MGALTDNTAIDGVAIYPLDQIHDERGAVIHMLRADQPHFDRFGEVYFSLVNPGVIKGWKKHTVMGQNFAVPVGEIRLVIYDDREGSPTLGAIKEIRVGVEHYGLICIPPLLWYGFQCTTPTPALIANCTTHPHTRDEAVSLPLGDTLIPFDWGAG